jgi:mono/diheme cytochrome c family protein
MCRLLTTTVSASVTKDQRAWWVGAVLAVLLGCRQDMYDQPRYEPLEASSFFENGQSSRPLVAGTVARGELRDDDHLYTAKVDGKFVESFPIEVDRTMLERGRDRFNIYCAPCHGRLGDGAGIIVKRGFSAPPSFHIDRLRKEPEGHFYDVITNGHGAMYSYASRVPPQDRWAITAYIRALQFSQNATIDDVPVVEKTQLLGVAR